MGSVGAYKSGGMASATPDSSANNSGNQDLQNFRNMSEQDAANFVNNIPTHSASWYTKQGMNGYNNLQKLVEHLNLHDKPVVLSDADYDNQMKANALNGVELHRGLGSDPSGQYQQQFLYGDKVYEGDGIHGEGIYMTTSWKYAKFYAGSNASNETVTGFIDKSKASVISEDALNNAWGKLNWAMRDKFGSPANYAIYKGYNVVHVPGGNWSKSQAYGNKTSSNQYYGKNGIDFYLPLTRDVLVMREHSKIH